MDARVDIRKLQLLNDRISQTIDALNQVRLSVHGLAHSPQAGAYGVPGAFGTSSIGVQGLPGYAFGAPQGWTAGVPFGGYNLQHATLPYAQPYIAPGIMPFAGAINSPTAWNMAAATGMTGGLVHSSPDVLEQRLVELRANDPVRITQTFPFAQPGVTPFPVI